MAAPAHGVGAPLRRKEDARLLAGQGRFVGDLRVPDLLDVAFVRSPVAHGRLLAIDCEATVDSGAYSSYPFSVCLEAAQVGSILPGPYKMDGYRCRTWSVATNKPPILPYRGEARTCVCLAREVTLDALARAAGIEAHELRLRNLVQPHEMPFDNITKKHVDSGDYPQALQRALAALDLPAWLQRVAAVRSG